MHISTYNVPLTCMFVSIWDFSGDSSGKESTCNCRSFRRQRFNPWVGQIPMKRARQPTLVLLLGEPMDRGVWPATVHRVAKSQTWSKQLSMHKCMYICIDFVYKTYFYICITERYIYIFLFLYIYLSNYICALHLCLNFTNSEKMKNYIIEISRVWNYSLILYRYLHYNSSIFLSYLTFSLWTCQLYLYFWTNAPIYLFF